MKAVKRPVILFKHKMCLLGKLEWSVNEALHIFSLFDQVDFLGPTHPAGRLGLVLTYSRQ